MEIRYRVHHQIQYRLHKPGTYDARVERNGIWSDWSRTPVQIIVQAATPTPPIQVAGAMSTAIPAADGKNYVNLQVSGNDDLYKLCMEKSWFRQCI